jgi:hypothetical protein
MLMLMLMLMMRRRKATILLLSNTIRGTWERIGVVYSMKHTTKECASEAQKVLGNHAYKRLDCG